MRNVLDSLAVHLQRHLQGDPAVNRMRARLNDPASCILRNAAVNLKLIDVQSYGAVEIVSVSLDIVGPEEDTVLTWCERVKQALLNQYADEIEYDNGTMRHTGRRIFWENVDLSFQHINTNQGYVHFNCTLDVRHEQPYT